MTDCPNENELLEYAERRLTAARAQQLDQHVAGCDDCRKLLLLDGPPTNAGRPTREDTPLAREEKTVRHDPLLGTQLGEYLVEERIGQGGMGVVYRGRQPVIGKTVAIKVVRHEVEQEDPSLVSRLVDEARAANAIGHHGIIDIFSFGETPAGQQYFVMEYLVGDPLNEYLKSKGRLPQEEVASLLEDLLGALGSAHAAGIVHRDLKPSNLFLVNQPDGTRFLKLLDFGLAKQLAARTDNTASNVVMGTPDYMAPEQVRAEAVGPAADLYAVGVIAFQLVTGRRPFVANSASAILAQHLETAPPKPSTLVEIHPRFESLILRLLSKKASDRPASAEAVRDELRAIWVKRSVDQTETEGRALPLPPPPEPVKTENRALWIVLGVTLAATSIVGLVVALKPAAEPVAPIVVAVTPPAPPVAIEPPKPEPVKQPDPVEAPPAEPVKPSVPALRTRLLAEFAKSARELESQGAETDPTAKLLLDDALARAKAATTVSELKSAEERLRAVRVKYLKRAR